MRFTGATSWVAGAALLLASCGGGGGSTPAPAPTPTPAPTPAPSGTVFVPPAQLSLSTAEVQQIIAQAVGEARARNKPSVIAVTDRVGNVLGVFAMTGAPALAKVSLEQLGGTAAPGAGIGLQGVDVPATAAAISKALTGAYLSSSGNAFSSRTASQIVQQHFPPGVRNRPPGPLTGVKC